MQRTLGPYKVAEVQAHTVVIYEDSTLDGVAIERLTPDQKSAKDAKKATNTGNGSLT